MLQAPEHFTVENLQHAYKVTKNKALVDKLPTGFIDAQRSASLRAIDL